MEDYLELLSKREPIVKYCISSMLFDVIPTITTKIKTCEQCDRLMAFLQANKGIAKERILEEIDRITGE